MSDDRPVQADEVPLHEQVTRLADRLQNEEGVDLWATARLLDRVARQLKADSGTQQPNQPADASWPPPIPDDLRLRAQAVLETLIPLAPYLGLVDLDYVQFPHPDGSIEGRLSWRWADPNRWDWPETQP